MPAQPIAVTPPDPQSDAGRVYRAVPQLGRLRQDVLLGDVWKQPELGFRDRILVTCSILAATGKLDELTVWMSRGIQAGITPDEFRGMVVQLAFYAGWPAALLAGKAALAHIETPSASAGSVPNGLSAFPLDGATRLYPLIGDPVDSARSPQRLTEGLRARGRNASCVTLQVPAPALESAMHGLAQCGNVDGLLITMPHKFTAFRYCASHSDRAQCLNAVSVTRRNPDGSWHGDILDGIAFVKAQILQGAQPLGATALLLGAGAAGSAIAISLLDAGATELRVHDLDAARARRLVDLLAPRYAARVLVSTPDPLGCTMVCNATPMGMHADDPLPLDVRLLAATMFVGDVISGHGETALLRAARAVGCRTADGDQMVDGQQEAMLDFLLGA